MLISTWTDGLFELGDSTRHSFSGSCVGALSRSRSGRVLGIVDQHAVVERISADKWHEIASSEQALSCVMCTREDVFVGTDDAAVLRLSADGRLESLEGFAKIDGREDWYAGTAVIEGKEVGPPLGVRSMSVTSDESVLLVNVHVGGIARSDDQGASWRPTVPIDYDVHEVAAHPQRPGHAIAAAAVGLCVSADGGKSWAVCAAGLDARYCSAAAYCRDTAFVAASEHHFSARGALYRLDTGGGHHLERVAGGLPEWLDGIVDTRCIGTLGSTIAIADRGGHVYASIDSGRSWSLRGDGFESPSAVVLL